jgi:hypothetical protein
MKKKKSILSAEQQKKRKEKFIDFSISDHGKKFFFSATLVCLPPTKTTHVVFRVILMFFRRLSLTALTTSCDGN